MAGFLDWLGGGRTRGDVGASASPGAAASTSSGDPYTQVSVRLGDYPPDTPPHRGDPLTLTSEQRAENLQHFVSSDAERIATLVSWLWREGIDGSLLFKGDDAALAEGRKIDAWLADWIPKRPFDLVRGDAEINPPYARWFASDRAGADLVFSLVSDLTRLNAAAISAAEPLFAWATVEDDLDRMIRFDPESNPTDQPSSEIGHLCPVRELYDGSVPVVLDLPMIVLQLVHQRMSPTGLPVFEPFPCGLQAAQAGAYHRQSAELRD